MVDLPIGPAGGSCHNQAGVIANNICGELRYGYPAVLMMVLKVQACCPDRDHRGGYAITA